MYTKEPTNDTELDYYIREFGEMLRLNSVDTPTPKQILNHVFQKLSNYKAVHG